MVSVAGAVAPSPVGWSLGSGDQGWDRRGAPVPPRAGRDSPAQRTAGGLPADLPPPVSLSLPPSVAGEARGPESPVPCVSTLVSRGAGRATAPRVPINAAARPSPPRGAREAHRQSRGTGGTATAQGGIEAPPQQRAPCGLWRRPLGLSGRGQAADEPGPPGSRPGPCLGNGVELENPEPGGRAGRSGPQGRRALRPRPSPRPRTQGALRMRWGWPPKGT